MRRDLPFRKAMAQLLIAGQVVLYLPGGLWAAPEKERPAPPEPPRRVQPNRTIPQVEPPPLYPAFSESPTDEEITRARVFEEPLVPIGKPAPAEAPILARALTDYQRRGGGEHTEALLAFLEGRHMSPWRASLLLNLGIVARRTGYYTRAMQMWEEAWELAKGATDPRGKAVADRAVGELARHAARLGNRPKLEQILEEVEGRDVGGSAGEMLASTRRALWVMQNRPDKAYRCGPLAIDRLLAFLDPSYDRPVRISTYSAQAYGTTLRQMRDLGNELGLDLQMARRVDRGAEIIVPAVVHWNAGHFTAMVAEKDGRYLLHDPTFGEELWISRRAFNDESSGYMLVPKGPLPPGWRSVSEDEGDGIWGKGPTEANNLQNQRCRDSRVGECKSLCPKSQDGKQKECPCLKEQGKSPPGGLAQYSFHTMLVNLHITDTPAGYSAPRGSAVGFAVTYNQREVFQPQTFSYGNVGPKWNYGWQSYIEDDPVVLEQPVNLYVRGGGQETYTGYDPATGAYAHYTQGRAQVVRTSEDPIRYERHMSDGSVDVYAQPDGALTFPRKVFLTESIDPQGNAVSFTYDASLRLVAVTDAIGQVTTLSYEHPTDPLKITKVTDPFGRFATLEYDASLRLVRITDVIDLVSEFSYGPGDFITSMTTPYGTTTFDSFDEGRRRWLEATDPLGGKERLEYLNDTMDAFDRFAADFNDFPRNLAASEIPTGFESSMIQNHNYRNTFYWDKRASALYPGDYTKAKLMHWLHEDNLSTTSGVVETEKEPLETMRTFYKYPNMTWQSTGSHATPSVIGRVMEDGSSQIRQFEYNASGKTIKSIDPLNRETVYVYGTGSTPDADPVNGTGLDLLEVKQKNGGSYDTLWSATYNAQHLPLTVTDAAGETTTYTYNAAGQVLTVTTPERAGISENRTTTYVYDTDGYLQTITGPAAGATTGFTYDDYGRVETVTSSDGDTVTYDYDALDRLTRVTYPDTTYEETVYENLDPVRRRDREGRWTETLYNALRQVVSTRDAKGRTTSYIWCDCGSLASIQDPNGRTTSWDRDEQGRVVKERRADGEEFSYTYETTSSRLAEMTDAEGQTTHYEYNLDDTLQSVSYPNATISTPTVSYAYDDAYNRLESMTDGVGTTGYGYYPAGVLGAGRLASVDGPLTGDTISYAYDELGRVVSRGLPSFAPTAAYDALGRLTTAGSTLGDFTWGYDGVTSRPLTLTYPNTQVSSYSYLGGTEDRRLQQIQHRAPGGAVLSQFDYTYDTVGNIETWQQKYGTNPATLLELGYDAVDQLTAATKLSTDPTPLTLKRYAYAYDPAGNRTTEQIDDAAMAASHNSRNQLLSRQPGGALRFQGSLDEEAAVTVGGKAAEVRPDNTFEGRADVAEGTTQVDVQAQDYAGNVRTNTYEVTQTGATTTYTYDANGSLTSDGTRTYEWDGANRLVRVTEGPTEIAAFAYDGQGRRAQKTAGGVTWTYIYDGEDILEERLSTGTTYHYVHGPGIDQPLARIDAATGTLAAYYLADHLGSIVQETDASGAVSLTREYDPWGNPIQGSATGGYAYTGREWDPEVNLYYYRARYYDPKVARFLSEDPIGFAAGTNLSSYVANNPVNASDPKGLQGVAYAFPPPDISEPPLPTKYKRPNPDCCDKTKIQEAIQNARHQIRRMDRGKAPAGKVAAMVMRGSFCDDEGNCVPETIDPSQFDPGIVTPTDPCVDYCTTLHEWLHFSDKRPYGEHWTATQRAIHNEYPPYNAEEQCLLSFIW